MPSAFDKFLDAVADLLGLSDDKPRQRQRPTPQAAPPSQASRPEPPAPPKQNSDAVLTSFYGTPIRPGCCHACGVRPVSPDYENLFCGRDCQRRWNFDVAGYRDERERRLADAMDACHERMEELHGDN